MTKDCSDVANFAPGDPAASTAANGYHPSSAIADAALDHYRRFGHENNLVGLPREHPALSDV
jgi:hypothetical protein